MHKNFVNNIQEVNDTKEITVFKHCVNSNFLLMKLLRSQITKELKLKSCVITTVFYCVQTVFKKKHVTVTKTYTGRFTCIITNTQIFVILARVVSMQVCTLRKVKSMKYTCTDICI